MPRHPTAGSVVSNGTAFVVGDGVLQAILALKGGYSKSDGVPLNDAGVAGGLASPPHKDTFKRQRFATPSASE